MNTETLNADVYKNNILLSVLAKILLHRTFVTVTLFFRYDMVFLDF